MSLANKDQRPKSFLSLANKTRNSMSLANKKAKYFRKDTIMNKMINRENTYYTIRGDDLFKCCDEYQDREYCVAHDKFQGCAFCSGFSYWEECSLGIVCGDGE
jgi:hypothetical protein